MSLTRYTCTAEAEREPYPTRLPQVPHDDAEGDNATSAVYEFLHTLYRYIEGKVAPGSDDDMPVFIYTSMLCFASESGRQRFLQAELRRTSQIAGEQFDVDNPSLQDETKERERLEKRQEDLIAIQSALEDESKYWGLISTFKSQVSLKTPFYFCVSCPPKNGTPDRDWHTFGVGLIAESSSNSVHVSCQTHYRFERGAKG